MNPDLWQVDDTILWLAGIIAACAILVTGITKIWAFATKSLTERIDKSNEEMSQLRADLDKQFGGNSGGIREAVNNVAERQKEIGLAIEVIHRRIDEHLTLHITEGK